MEWLAGKNENTNILIHDYANLCREHPANFGQLIFYVKDWYKIL